MPKKQSSANPIWPESSPISNATKYFLNDEHRQPNPALPNLLGGPLDHPNSEFDSASGPMNTAEMPQDARGLFKSGSGSKLPNGACLSLQCQNLFFLLR